MTRPALSAPAARLAVLALLALTALAAHFISRLAVNAGTTADVSLDLPGTVGDWKGESLFYCQNEQCLRVFRAGELTGVTGCPVCGGALDPVSKAERNILPPDTLIARKVYTNPRGVEIQATVVLSGAEQKSIHRPEQCLPAQGFVIESSKLATVPLPGRPPLGVTVLQARQAVSGVRVLFAYCFAGGGRETPNHLRRLAWMAWDNVAHGYRARWAYVSVQTGSNGMPSAAEQRLTDFARRFYPLIHRR